MVPNPKRRMRKSLDVDRPDVDTAIKGVPQALDDPSVPTSSQRPTPSLIPSTPSRRMDTFRETTRAKLASFSGFIKGDERSEVQAEGSHGAQRHTGRARPGLQTRSSSLATQAPFPHPPLSPISPALPPSAWITQQETAPTESTDAGTTEDFSQLFTPSTTGPTRPLYAPSVNSSQSSVSNRDRVMGIKTDALPGAPRVFVQPKLSDVVPFASDSPFSAWDVPSATQSQGSHPGRRPSMRQSRYSEATGTSNWSTISQTVPEKLEAGWKNLSRHRGEIGEKKVWMDESGEVVAGVYKVGYERDVLDLEARLHETMWEVAGDRHMFCTFPDGEEPKTVLDVGTGIGLWPISQALEWPNTTFIGLDFVPCQTDLQLLADAERRARSTSEVTAKGLGMWESVENRIKWDRADFLDSLPYDTGVFDMIHIRFIGLGVPESKWAELIEECTRVLKRGGTLEIVETAYTLSSSPTSLKNSFNSLLLSDMVQPLPVLPLRFVLPATPGLLAPGSLKPVFEKTWTDPPGALKDHVMGWIKSALEYKGTGLTAGRRKMGPEERVRRELCIANGDRWECMESVERVAGGEEKNDEATIWAWVIKKA